MYSPQAKGRRRRWRSENGRRSSRLGITEQRRQARAYEEMEPRLPKLTREQRRVLQKVNQRWRTLFHEVLDDLLNHDMIDQAIDLMRSLADR